MRKNEPIEDIRLRVPPLSRKPLLALNPIDKLEISVRSVGPDKNPLVIIDNALADPDRVREFALALQYEVPEYPFPGLISNAHIPADELQHFMAQLVFDRAYGMHGDIIPLQRQDDTRFSVITADLREVPDDYYYPNFASPRSAREFAGQPHVDNDAWLAILIHLTPPELCSGGTSFWRHRRTGLQSWIQLDPLMTARVSSYTDIPFLERVLQAFGDEPVLTLDEAKESLYEPPQVFEPHKSESTERWELLDFAEAKFNRLVCYPTWQFHSATHDPSRFGDTLEESRITLNQFVPLCAVASDDE